MNTQSALDRFDVDGRIWLRGAVVGPELASLSDVSQVEAGPGARVAMGHPLAQAIALSSLSSSLEKMWPGMKPVRMVMFDKTPSSNWGLPWHQDRVIAVRDRADVQGFGNWSEKSQGWHCEPPLEVLQRMLFLRLHLDPCPPDSGPMEIALGSHAEGLVSAQNAERVAVRYASESAVAEPGDALAMSMLMLHRSTPALVPTRRRTLRIDYALDILPLPLQWQVF